MLRATTDSGGPAEAGLATAVLTRQRIYHPQLLLVLDLSGILVFSVEGAMMAIQSRLDLLGVLVVAFVTAQGGGIIRDAMIGAIPVGALRDWRYLATALVGGSIAFLGFDFVRTVPVSVMIELDAAGLSLFAVAGAEKALDYNIQPFIAIFMGGITGVGGGTLRDMLLNHVPAVLRIDVYATAALAGATVMVCGRRLGLPPAMAAVLGVAACFGLRLLAVAHHWNLPHATDYHW